jgi:O-antigen/teichoic acid export membrane protein
LNYLAATLNGQERFGVSASVAVASQLTELAGVAVLLLLVARTAEMGFLGYLIGLAVGVAITIFVVRGFLRSVWDGWPRFTSFASALSLGVRGQLGNVATLFNYRLDVFVVNAFLNTAQVGIYSLGVVISESLWQIPHAAAVALFPRTARTLALGATEFTCAIIRQVLIISCLSGIAIAVVSPIAVPLIFGSRFSGSVSVIWWILPGTVSLSLAKVMSADLAARGKPEYSSICSFVALAVTVALDFTLIPRMGIRGAALASSIAYLVHTVLVAIAIKRVLGVNWKLLLMPSYDEWAVYKQAWLRLKLWLRSAAIGPASVNSDV